MTAETGPGQKHPKTPEKKPLEPEGGSPSEADRLHAATTIQSAVTPEDYPPEKRALQVAAGTDGTRPVEGAPIRRKTPPG